jgi:hypothetical protein
VISQARTIFDGSDAAATRAYYAQLSERGPAGLVAMNLMRAQKCSTRAKAYRGRANKDAAYARKEYSLRELCKILMAHAESLHIQWGWARDDKQKFYPWVLYVDLPLASQIPSQASWHAPARGEGPDYPDVWDGTHLSERHVLAYCDQVMASRPQPESPSTAVVPVTAVAIPPKLTEQPDPWLHPYRYEWHTRDNRASISLDGGKRYIVTVDRRLVMGWSPTLEAAQCVAEDLLASGLTDPLAAAGRTAAQCVAEDLLASGGAL